MCTCWAASCHQVLCVCCSAQRRTASAGGVGQSWEAVAVKVMPFDRGAAKEILNLQYFQAAQCPHLVQLLDCFLLPPDVAGNPHQLHIVTRSASCLEPHAFMCSRAPCPSSCPVDLGSLHAAITAAQWSCCTFLKRTAWAKQRKRPLEL